MNNKTFLKKVEIAMVSGRFFKTAWRYLIRKMEWANPEIILMNLARRRLCIKTEVVPNKILFQTFQGDYTCNPKYITEEIIRQKLDVDIVWSLRRESLKKLDRVPPEVRVVEQFSYDYFKELASAKIWVVNSVEFLKKAIIKKDEQILIETWHGSLGIKRFSKDVNSGKAWVKAAEKCGRWTNYCISNSDFENSVYKETFWPKAEILQYGHPRNDLLVKMDDERAQSIKKYIYNLYNIPKNNKIILYGPTFRDSHFFDCYNIDEKGLLEALKTKFGGEWTLLTRYHPTVRKLAPRNSVLFKGHSIDVTSYEDIQELMAIADVAITDYSSWIYDFVLTGRPGFIFATDVEDYYSERGFYYPLEDTPFAIAKDNDDLISDIMNFDENSYYVKVQKFLKDKGCIEDGHAAEKVTNKLREIAQMKEI